MVKTIRKFETVHFSSTKDGANAQTIELEINHENKSFTICTGNEESVSFAGDSIESAELKIDALKVAIKYLKENL